MTWRASSRVTWCLPQMILPAIDMFGSCCMRSVLVVLACERGHVVEWIGTHRTRSTAALRCVEGVRECGEGRREPMPPVDIKTEFVMARWILDKGVLCADHSG
jgi:hypothetical protein